MQLTNEIACYITNCIRICFYLVLKNHVQIEAIIDFEFNNSKSSKN